MAIQRLPGAVATQIKSSTTIASLNDAVLGLLRNAIDAGASRVVIQVDYGRGACSVEDDGTGIPPAEFLPEGGLGKLYCTSKFPPNSSLYGRRGTFLASAAALSLLSVVSRCSQHEAESTLTMYNGKTIRRQTSAVKDSVSAEIVHGTRVSVNDLFGCMPVRSRLRPSPGSSAWSRDWDRLIQAIVALLLACPGDISVIVEDMSNGTKRSFNAQGPADASRTARLLAQAGLYNANNVSAWVGVEGSTPNVRISGSICLEPAASKRAQFLHIGIEPLPEAHQPDNLYTEINKIFTESNFGAGAGKKGSGLRDGRGPIERFVREVRPAKAVDRWPMFCLNIALADPVDVDDILDDRRPYLATIADLLRTMLVEFLDSHGFHDSTWTLYGSDDGPDTAPPSPTKKQKQGGSNLSLRIADTGSKRDHQSLPERRKSVHPPSSLFSSWPQTKSARSLKAKAAKTDIGFSDVPDGPKAGKLEETSRFFVNPEEPLSHGDEEKGHDESGCGTHSQMKDWDGDTLTSGDLKISRSNLQTAVVIGQVDRKFILIRASAGDEETRQPDQTGGAAAGPLLILIDQHAADERCRVESILEEYFVRAKDSMDAPFPRLANTTALERPLHFALADNERPLLQRSRAYFRYWGVVYDVLSPLGRSEADSTILRVLGLPAAIAERCRLEPRLVVDLIRKEIWAQPKDDLAMPQNGFDMSWSGTMHGCPRGILDLVNSRACRSAIKFNDQLSHEECSDLLVRLLRCSFPFQCAHGRPSMVPLLHLGANSVLQEDEIW